jgi:hypothetical protein
MIQRILDPRLPKPDDEHLRNLLDAFVGSVPVAFPVVDLGKPHPERLPKVEGVKYVYVGGSWDCFGSAHVEYLGRVKGAVASSGTSSGTCKLVVGIWRDEVRALLNRAQTFRAEWKVRLWRRKPERNRCLRYWSDRWRQYNAS